MLENPVLKFAFRCGDDILTASGSRDEVEFTCEYSQNGYRLWVLAHKDIVSLICELRYKYDYPAGSTVYAGGYQSWTHSREYGAHEIQKGLRLPVRYGFARKYASVFGDYDFATYSLREGDCHSFYYTYVRDKDEISFAGSLDESRGYTVFYHNRDGGQIKVVKDLEGLTLRAGERYKLFDLYFCKGGRNQVFDAYFEKLGTGKPREKRLCGYTSWYNLFGKIDEQSVMRDLDGLKNAGVGAQIFQIDDGYQAAVGDWLETKAEKFPSGMKKLCDEIHARGFRAGIWLAPYLCAKNSRVAAEHPDWLVCKDGKPVIGNVGWGGAYVLDPTNEGVREYLSKVFDVVLNEWGYDMVKLDFLYAAAMFPKDGKTRGELMTGSMKFLRACVGEKWLLGCGVPLFPAFGTCDFCRVGSDVDLSFRERIFSKLTNNEIVSTYNAMTSSAFRQHLDGRAFVCDPDVFFLREKNLKFTKRQKKLLAKFNSLVGGVLFVSDNAAEYGEEEKALARECFGRQATVSDVRYAAKNVIEIIYEENGEKKALRFNAVDGRVFADGKI